MIRYALICVEGHGFESRFPSSDSYDTQRRSGLVSCPVCGSTSVDKAIMAPSVKNSDRTPATVPADVPGPVSMMSEEERAFRRLVREVRDHVTRNADYVGDRFATLARAMHEGEMEHRAIYGEASPEEVKALHEDEVEVFPLPLLPDEQN